MAGLGADEPRANECLERARWQDVLFAKRLRRGHLLGLKHDFRLRPVRIRVVRNQPFEFVAAVMSPFLAYAGYAAEFEYSGYDDSLGGADAPPADLEIVWLDFERYANAEAFTKWLRERLAFRRASSTAPILLASRPSPAGEWREFNRSLEHTAEEVPGVTVCDVTPLAERLGEAYFDLRAARITAMTLSGEACVELARLFGLKWIPSALGARVKAIALDLDNTLYHGVLGEDGPAGIELTEAHLVLQRELLEFRQAGVFLTVVSRNQPEDAARLFAERQDLILRPEHFSARSISWNAKSAGLREAAAALRIGPDSILVIDDNPGELAAIAAEFPGARTLYASSPELVCRALRLYPGLSLEPAGAADRLRVADLAASELRAELQAKGSPEDYLRSLDIHLSFFYKPAEHRHRLHELSNKTNQFNSAFRRFSEAEVARFLEDPERSVVAIGLRDKLSDSGLIAAVFGRWADGGLAIEEVVISCRALGRGIEDVMITEAIRGMVARSGCSAPSSIVFRFVEGPRNQPFAKWLSDYAHCPSPTVEVPLAWDEQDRATMIQEAEKKLTVEWNP